jgi:hypothetical protein
VQASGDLTAGSALVSSLAIVSGAFHLGQEVTGNGIPAGATVKEIGAAG